MLRGFAYILFIFIPLLFSNCKVKKGFDQVDASGVMPQNFPDANSEKSSGTLNYKDFFGDPILVNLIDTALVRNYDLLATLQRIEAAKADITRVRGSLFPVVNGNVTAGRRRFGKYTMDGVGNYDTNFSPNIESSQRMPEHLPDYYLGVQTSWEADIWGKIRN